MRIYDNFCHSRASGNLEHVSKPSFVAKSQNCESRREAIPRSGTPRLRDAPAEQEAYQEIRRVRAVGRRSRNSVIAADASSC